MGHEELRSDLERDVPPVVLIEGPEGIGKSMVAREAARRLARGPDVVEVGRSICTSGGAGAHDHVSSCRVMTTSVARTLRETLTVRRRGERAVLFDAGMASEDAANLLLKTLEEPPPRVHFILWASRPPLETVRSRATRMTARPLTDEQVRAICLAAGVSSSRADRATAMAAGRPARALEVAAMMDQAATVQSLVRAAVGEDEVLVANVCSGLAPSSGEDFEEVRRSGDTERGRRARSLLRTTLVEARTGEYRLTRREEVVALSELGEGLDPIIERAGTEGPGSLVTRQVALSIQAAVRRSRR